MPDPQQSPKRAAGRAAADLVPEGARLGLGTGSTVRHVLERLAERIAGEGLTMVGVPTSEDTARRARALGIPLADLDELDGLDLAIDGADEVDPRKNLIKGGGGALLREKIVACAASELVVVVGEDKLSERLGGFALPVEVTPFGHRHTAAAVSRLGVQPRLRTREGEPFVTDNGNFVLDCPFGEIEDPSRLETELDRIPGVVECGLFVGLAGRILVGRSDGGVTVIP